MRYALVINAASGTALAQESIVVTIRDLFAANGLDAVLVPEEGSLPERFARAATMGDVVVIGGGDGSIACAATALAGKQAVCAILPLGTANLVARDLGIPLDLAAAVAMLPTASPRAIDTAQVNGSIFLCNAVLGFSPILARKRERHRRDRGMGHWLRLARAMLGVFTRFRPVSMNLEIAGERRRVRTHALVVANNPFDERIGGFLTRSRLDRGTLAVYVLERSTLWTLWRLALGMTVGDWRRVEGLTSYDVRSLVIGGVRRRVHMMIDGEVRLVQMPLRFRIRPASMAILLPRETQEGPPGPPPDAPAIRKADALPPRVSP